MGKETGGLYNIVERFGIAPSQEVLIRCAQKQMESHPIFSEISVPSTDTDTEYRGLLCNFNVTPLCGCRKFV